MRVLINMAPLGAESHGRDAATGVYRVAEQLAGGLCRIARQEPEELRVCFHSTAGLRAAKLYYDRHLDGPGAEFAARPWQLALGRVAFAMDAFVRRTQGNNALPLRASRRAAVVGSELISAPLGRPAARVTDATDVYHSPSLPVPAWVKRHPTLRARRFTMVHDVIALTNPEYFPAVTVAFTRRVINGLDPEDWVFCNSHATRTALLEQSRCDPAKVFVTYLAAAGHFRPEPRPEVLAAVRARYGIPTDVNYFLSVCTLERRKNLAALIRGFTRFCRENGNRRREVRLVLTGGAGWLTQEITAALEDAGEEVRGRILRTGFVPDEDLAAIYSGARGFVYLSRAEGFGLPPLEAMACGVPVICSNVSSLPEVVGNAGLLLAPDDLAGLAAAFGTLLDDHARHAELAARAKVRAARFSWEGFTRQTLDAYRQALGHPPAHAANGFA